jgi:hypothetical protein
MFTDRTSVWLDRPRAFFLDAEMFFYTVFGDLT